MDDTKKIIEVYTGSLIRIRKLKQDLEAKGIRVITKDTDILAAYTGFDSATRSTIQLSIFKKDIEKAKPIIESFKKQFNL